MTPINLTPQELHALTGYAMPSRQLETLHQRGYTRAYRTPGGAVVLTRAHFEAVEAGRFAVQNANTHPHDGPNVSFFRKAA